MRCQRFFRILDEELKNRRTVEEERPDQNAEF
jgi:hypothetical protein